MKRLRYFLSLLLCVCLLFPVFSVSAFAVDVNGHNVTTQYWFSSAENDLTEFENTVISTVAPSAFNIGTVIELADIIAADNVFNFQLDLEFDSSNLSVDYVRFFGEDGSLIDELEGIISGNSLLCNGVQLKTNCTKIVVQFTVNYPSWTVINNICDVTIDGVTYKFERGMTWDSWLGSAYNTLGLFDDGDLIYLDDDNTIYKLVTSDGSTVTSTDSIDNSISYVLQKQEEVATKISFTIGGESYTAVVDMTWSQWVQTLYCGGRFTIQDGAVYYTDTNSYVSYNGSKVNPSSYIIHDRSYNLVEGVHIYKIRINGVDYRFDEGMTWADWVASSYNTCGITFRANSFPYLNSYRVYQADGLGGYISVSKTSLLVDRAIYGSQSYCQGITSGGTFVSVLYHYNFKVTGVSVEITDTGGLLGNIISWVKKIYNGIINLPSNIGSKFQSVMSWVLDQIKGLFIPDRVYLEDFAVRWRTLFEERFGLLYQAEQLLEDFARSFTYQGTQGTIELPSVTVNLVGVPFTFGGYEVDVIPDGFEGLINTLKMIVNMVCTALFVNGMRKRLEEVLK